MKTLNAEKIEILQNKVKLTISLDYEKYNRADRTEKIKDIVNLAILNGEGANILKQLFSEDGTLKINDKHTFY